MEKYRGIVRAIAGVLLLTLCTVQLREGITEYDTVSAGTLRTANVSLPELPQLEEEISCILSGGSKEFFQGYPVDESFLLWIAANYGESVMERLAANVQSEKEDNSVWYELTGSTIHVLWLLYCRDLNYSSYLLKNVTWVDCADETDITMDFIGDSNFSEDWDMSTALGESGGAIESGVSPEILEELNSADITIANSYTYGGEAEEIRYFLANGRKIAIVFAAQTGQCLAYTQEAGENSADALETPDPEIFLETIREAEKNSDYVIACVHWGTEGNLYPDGEEQKLARQYAEAGADIVIGGHAHRLQGVSYIGGIPVIYSLGNFGLSTGDLYATILQVTINRFGELNVTFLPCEQKDMTVSLLTGEKEVDGFYEYLADLSSGIGIDENGTVGRPNKDTLKVQWSYLSGLNYGTHYRGTDLAGNGIDIVGNLK